MIVKHGRLLTYGLMALLFTACSKDDEAASYERLKAQEPVTVAFGAYVGDAAGTRAGWPGTIGSADVLATNAAGFGVFAFDTEEKTFDGVTVSTTTRSLIPDFMYNEYITWHADATDPAKSEWLYADPNSTKYWPNDFAESAVDGRGTDAATGSTKHYISFFAYAPYAGVLSQGDATKHNGATSMSNDGTASGIVAVSGNNHNGDPIITYKLADDAKKVVDLLWGTAGGGQNGEFNLATGKWNVLTTDHVTIDHVIDQTGSAGNKLNTDIMEPAAGVTAWADLTMPGVEETFKNVYAEEVFPLLFIPGTAPKLKFTVEYVVRTKDDKLEKGYTEVNQKISKVLTFPTLEPNKQYNIAMHLGLTSIKFDATVSNWEVATGTGTGSGSGASTELPVDLPINVQ